MRIGLIILISVVISSCNQEKSMNTVDIIAGKTIEVNYATGFTITDYDSHIIITLTAPYPGANQALTYRLNRDPSSAEGFDIPIDRIVCTSTTHLPALSMLDVANSLVGFPSIEYISDTIQWQRAQTGELAELGTSNQLDVERLIELEPDAVMAFSMGGETQQLDKLAELGVDIIYNADYLEESILGRAEWIKVIGALYDRSDLADSIFKQIESRYLALQSSLSSIDNRPTVMSGLMYGDAWYMPGGNNWGAKVIEDAGGQYLWDNDSSSAWIEIGFEGVMDRAVNADLWIGIAHLESLEELSQADIRYKEFAPYQSSEVYTYGARKGLGGGISYLELGYARPDMVLADMIKIIHPEVLPDYDLYFYGQLK
jgi:iron complex transport system substrate-binding protein